MPGANRNGGGGRVKRPPRAARRGKPDAGAFISVDADQRRRLIECCAFFRAAHFRPLHPGGFRKQDLLEAEASIDAVLARHKVK